jgi:hypothetical protein
VRTIHFISVRTLMLIVTVLGAFCFVNAQIGLPVAQKGPKAAVTNLPNRTLQRTIFQINPAAVDATCSDSGCLATAVAFTRPITCPVTTGKTCTLYLHVESQVAVTANDDGLFRFLIDGRTPSPGPTDKNGYFSWDLQDPNSAVEEARSYAIVATVKNTSNNQSHSIEMDIGCGDLTGDGCVGTLGFASMSISVFTP